MADEVLYEVTDAIATLTLNRPDRMNAYVPEMGDALVDAFRRARDDDAVRAVILTGAGRAFCAGIDLEYLKRVRAGEIQRDPPLGEEHFIRGFPAELVRFPKPTIAALNGAAVGVGITMVLPCDIRIAAEGAKLALPFAKLNLIPGLGSTHLLPKLVGLARSLDLVLTGRTIRAEEAAAMGLVTRAVPAGDLLASARETAALTCDGAPAALAAAKRALHAGAALSLEEAMQREAEASAALRSRGN